MKKLLLKMTGVFIWLLACKQDLFAVTFHGKPIVMGDYVSPEKTILEKIILFVHDYSIDKTVLTLWIFGSSFFFFKTKDKTTKQILGVLIFATLLVCTIWLIALP